MLIQTGVFPNREIYAVPVLAMGRLRRLHSRVEALRMTYRIPSPRFSALAGLFMASSLLAGCADMSSVGDTVPDTAITQRTLVTMTAASVGPIDGQTRYSTKAIEAALPGFTTQPIQMAEEDRTRWTTGVFHDGFQVLQVLKGSGGKIGAIHAVSANVTGPNGERLGMRFDQVGTSISDCRVGRNLWRDMAICPSRGAPNVKLVYAVTQYDGPFDALPPREQLASARIQRIVWTPPTQ